MALKKSWWRFPPCSERSPGKLLSLLGKEWVVGGCGASTEYRAGAPCGCAGLQGCTSLHICVNRSLCLTLGFDEHVCVCVYTCVLMCAHTCVHACTCAHARVYVCVRACVCGLAPPSLSMACLFLPLFPSFPRPAHSHPQLHRWLSQPACLTPKNS